jgi:CheY-specific phosphatase CheX
MADLENSPLDNLLNECCRELFSSYSLEAAPRNRQDFPESRLVLCGVMGFVGKTIRGALVLGTTREPLEESNPLGCGSPRDWVCELANQLAGRFKNRLLGRGVEVLLTTPIGLSGDNLIASPGSVRAPQVFAVGGGFVCVWIDAEYAPGFELPAAAPLEERAVPEGETLLF